MRKPDASNNKMLIRVTLMLLVLSILFSTAIMVPTTTAAGMQILPGSGPVGTIVTLKGHGYTVNSEMKVEIGNEIIPSQTSWEGSVVTCIITIPLDTPVGKRYIYLTDSDGNTYQLPFQVTEGEAPPSTSPTPSSGDVSPSPTGTPKSSSTKTPKPSSNAGLDPTIIVVIAVALVAIFIPVIFIFARRGGGKRDRGYYPEGTRPDYPYDRPGMPPAPGTYQPQSPYQAQQYQAAQPYQGSYRPYQSTYQPQYSRSSGSMQYRPSGYGYGSSAPRSYGSSRYGQSPSYSSSYGRSTGGYTKMCPSCRQTVRGDLNICPNCNRRL